MINVKLNYVLLQTINATFFILSYLFVKDYLDVGDDRALAEFLILLAVILAGCWAFLHEPHFLHLSEAKRSERSTGCLAPPANNSLPPKLATTTIDPLRTFDCGT